MTVGLVYTATINGLVSGKRYYMIAKAFDSNGNESCATPEITFIAK